MQASLAVDGVRYPAIWLRDNCQCHACVAPGGQKLFGIADLPAETSVAAHRFTDDAVDVTFAPDGHRSRFALSWLASQRLDGSPPYDERTEQAKSLWEVVDRFSVLPGCGWDDFATDPVIRAECLESLLDVGFVVLHGVAPRGRAVEVAETFGFVRRTNYGEIFDVRVEDNPANLAFSSLPIAPHTDNPYREPVPTIQLLHCLTNAAEGGDSGLVDGFAAAARLRADAPKAFELLARTPVTFRYRDVDADLSATNPMIGLDPVGRIKQIRFNNRSMRPVFLRSDEVADFYAAYRGFADLLARPHARLDFRLDPGDCLIFDNTRLLHARTGFTASGQRHLQGCYADLDSASSALQTLRREIHHAFA